MFNIVLYYSNTYYNAMRYGLRVQCDIAVLAIAFTVWSILHEQISLESCQIYLFLNGCKNLKIPYRLALKMSIIGYK